MSTGTEYRPVGKKTFVADEQPDKIFIPVKTARQFVLGLHNTSILPVSGAGRVRVTTNCGAAVWAHVHTRAGAGAGARAGGTLQ